MYLLSGWFAPTIPLYPSLCLIGDRNQITKVSKSTFSVIIAGARIILRHWKTTRVPDFKEGVDTMLENASYAEQNER